MLNIRVPTRYFCGVLTFYANLAGVYFCSVLLIFCCFHRKIKYEGFLYGVFNDLLHRCTTARSQLSYATEVWSPQTTKLISKVESVQRRATFVSVVNNGRTRLSLNPTLTLKTPYCKSSIKHPTSKALLDK